MQNLYDIILSVKSKEEPKKIFLADNKKSEVII